MTLLSDKFKFEDDFVPVSPIVWAYINCQLTKPAELYMPHHIDISNMEDPDNQLFLLTADDESFLKDKSFIFKRNRKIKVTIDLTLAKFCPPHFCSNCIASNGRVYRDIPKVYFMVRADKKEDDVFFVEFCFLYRQKGCKKVSCNLNLFLNILF